MDKGVADTIKDHKRKHDEDEDNDDEDPSAGPNQGKKTKRKRTNESESSKKPSTTKENPKGNYLSKGSKNDKFASSKEPVEEPIAEVVMDDAGKDVNNPEGDHYPFDMSKPLPLQGHPCHLTVAADYFFNNDLEYLKSFDLKRTYTMSITKTKVARVKKIHGYGHMEEIVVKRVDRQLYKFKEGDFMDLHLNDIEDMLLFAVQHKLFHLTDNNIVDFIVALCMLTRSLIIKKWVKDLQLGVDSY
nr:hypothetical protein [Tanacetum cinerariifolium]